VTTWKGAVQWLMLMLLHRVCKLPVLIFGQKVGILKQGFRGFTLGRQMLDHDRWSPHPSEVITYNNCHTLRYVN